MKKCLALFLVLAVFAFSAPLAEAQIDVSISPENVTVAPGSIASYVLTVENTQDTPDKFIITYDGPHIEWKIPGDLLLSVEPGKSKSTSIIFNTYGEDASYTFDVTATSQANPTVFVTAPLYLNVKVPPAVLVNGISWARSGDEIDVSVGLEGTKEYDADLVIAIKDGDRIIKAATVPFHTAIGNKTISETMSLSDVLAGTYALVASVEGQKAAETLEIPAVNDMAQTVERGGNMMVEEVTVTVTNNGNVVERDYVVTRTANADMVTGFSITPSDCSGEPGNNICNFIIPELQPGESMTIIYKLEFWPSYAKLAAAVIIIIILSLWYYSRITKPKIRKSARSKGLNEHHVILEIRGSGLKHAKNVVIRDWVSPLARVMHEGSEKLRPVLRKSEAGTELIWKLGDVIPKEERIISYKIKTLVKGSLKMPRAYMRYRDNKGGRVRIYSKPILIE
jgi:hypothetical protein